MASNKFQYNPDSLEYHLIQDSFWLRIKNVLLISLVSLFLGLLGFLTSSRIFNTPADKKLREVNHQLLNQYQTLDNKLTRLDIIIRQLSVNDDSIYRTILGVNPVPEEVRDAGQGGQVRYNSIGNEKYDKIVSNTSKRLDQLLGKVRIQKKSYDEVMLLAQKNNDRMRHLPAIIPISNFHLKRIGDGFGPRFHPILRIWRPHEGIDFTASKGTEVHATADGHIDAIRFSGSLGRYIVINHGFGIETFYGHLSGTVVKKGQQVKRGQVIGAVGSTGLSSGPHLHYEVHVNGKEVDPANYLFMDLTPEEYEQVRKLSRQENTIL